MKKSFILVLSTFSSRALAKKIAQSLVKEKLAACVQISSAIQSTYFWKGKICSEKEFVLSVKTKATLYKKVEKRILELHSYEVPEIIALPITQGSGEYLKWLHSQTL